MAVREVLLLLSLSSHSQYFQGEIEPTDMSAPALQLHGQLCCPTWHCSCVLLQPNVLPGNCWAFKGHQGQVVIRLPARVYLTAITVQHITKEASPSGTIISAPKDIAVFVSLLGPAGGDVALGGGQGRLLLAFVQPLSFVSCTLLSTATLSVTLQGLKRSIPPKTCSGQAPEGS